MWLCSHCGEQNEGELSACWRCSMPSFKPPHFHEDEDQPAPPPDRKTAPWRVEFRLFRPGPADTWEDVFSQAAAFANELGPERLIGLSHSGEGMAGLVVVWHWVQGWLWTCPQCGERLEDQFAHCWRCSALKPDNLPAGRTSGVADTIPDPQGQSWHMACQVFRGAWETWDQFLGEAASFATGIGPECLISITHSGAEDEGVASVLYFSQV